VGIIALRLDICDSVHAGLMGRCAVENTVAGAGQPRLASRASGVNSEDKTVSRTTRAGCPQPGIEDGIAWPML